MEFYKDNKSKPVAVEVPQTIKTNITKPVTVKKEIGAYNVHILVSITIILIVAWVSIFEIPKYLNANKIKPVNVIKETYLDKFLISKGVVSHVSLEPVYVGLNYIESNYNIDKYLMAALFFNKSEYKGYNIGGIDYKAWGLAPTQNLFTNVIYAGYIFKTELIKTKDQNKALASYLGLRDVTVRSLANSGILNIIKDYQDLRGTK